MAILSGVPKKLLPAIQSFEKELDGYWVNLNPGWQWSGQHAFGCETKAEAMRLIRQIEPCDCERCINEAENQAQREVEGERCINEAENQAQREVEGDRFDPDTTAWEAVPHDA